MLKIATDLSGYALAAGEPFLFELQLQETSGAVTDLSARAFQLSFYSAGRTLIEKIDPELLVDATGQFLRFARDGRFSDGLFGQQISVELAERYRTGRNVLAVGVMTIAASSAGVMTFDNGVVGQFVVRAALKANASQPGVLTPSIQILPYQGNLGTPAPTFTTAPSISRNGSRLTGNDGVIANGVAKTREWLLSGTVIATGGIYDLVGTEDGQITYRVLAEGAGGTLRVSSAPITVTPTVTKVTITGTPPANGQVGQAYTFTPATANGTSTKTFTLSAGTLLGGLSFSTTTGAITGTPTVAGTMSGLVITVTDSTGSASTSATNVTIAAAPTGAQPVYLAFAGSSSPDRYTYEGSGTANTRIRKLNTGTGNFDQAGAIFCTKVGEALLSMLDRGLNVIPGGIGGSTLQKWANEASYTQTVADRIAQGGGKCDYVLLQVGGNDVNFNAPTDVAVQMGLIRQVISNLRTKTGIADLKIIIVPTQDYPNNLPALSIQRQAETRVAAADANVFYGISVYDIPTSDGTHQVSPDGYAISGARFGKRLAALIAGQPDQRGPYVSAAAPVSLTQTDVTITHRLGSDFTPTTGITGFLVYSSSGASLAVSAADRVSSTVIRLTHAARTSSDPGTVLYMPNGTPGTATGGNADDTTIVRDNSATAWPMESSGSPVALAAFTGGTPAPAPSPSPAPGTPTYTATGKKAQVDYGSDSNKDVPGWNNRKVTAMQTATPLLDTNGSATGWSERETTGLVAGGSGTFGSLGGEPNPLGSGVYPDDVIKEYISHNSGSNANQSITGLDDTKAYDIVCFASRKASGRSVKYTVGAVSQTLDASNTAGATGDAGNLQTVVTFPKVRPTAGVINIGWTQVAGGFGYFNALVVTEYAIS